MDWQGRCSQLIALVLQRRFAAGEFERLDDVAWAALVREVRDAVATDARVEVDKLRTTVAQLSAREAAHQKALAAGLTEAEINALGAAPWNH